jgi:enoyl-CoA hydratase
MDKPRFENIIVEQRDEDIVRITLNRPGVLNALNAALCTDLRQALEDVRRDESVSVVILTGAGRAFSAGLDFSDQTDVVVRHDIMRDVFSLLRGPGPPVIAAVNGFAITGGFELALACDIVIASSDAVFRDTHAQAGIVPGGGNTQRLPRIVGEKKAKEILFASDFISAAEGEKLGFVNRVVPPEKLDEECMLLARKIAAQPKHVIRKIRQVMDDGLGMDFDAATQFELSESLDWCKGLGGEEFANRGQSIIDGGRARIRDGLSSPD